MRTRGVGFIRRSFGVALLLLLPTGAVAAAQTAPATELRDVSVSTQPDAVTIVVKTTGEVKYQAELMDRPHRLVLDFAGNVKRHGPIDAVKPEPARAGEGEAPLKLCPACNEEVALNAQRCPNCGHIFPPPEGPRLDRTASTLSVVCVTYERS